MGRLDLLTLPKSWWIKSLVKAYRSVLLDIFVILFLFYFYFIFILFLFYFYFIFILFLFYFYFNFFSFLFFSSLFLFPLTGYIFENQEDATQALTTMNGQKLVDDQPPVHGINSSSFFPLSLLAIIFFVLFFNPPTPSLPSLPFFALPLISLYLTVVPSEICRNRAATKYKKI